MSNSELTADERIKVASAIVARIEVMKDRLEQPSPDDHLLEKRTIELLESAYLKILGATP